MNDVTIALLGVAACVLMSVGFMLGAWWRAGKEDAALLELAERADVNGQRLCAIARELRSLAAGASRADPWRLRDWAADLDGAAAAHLQCINAIGIEALRAAGATEGGYLGELRLHPARRAADLPRRQQGRGHHANA